MLVVLTYCLRFLSKVGKVLYWEQGPSCNFQQDGELTGRLGELDVFLLLLLLRGRRIPTSFSALLCLSFPVIPAPPLTLVLTLEAAGGLAFPSAAEAKQAGGLLLGVVKCLSDVFW